MVKAEAGFKEELSLVKTQENFKEKQNIVKPEGECNKRLRKRTKTEED